EAARLRADCCHELCHAPAILQPRSLRYHEHVTGTWITPLEILLGRDRRMSLSRFKLPGPPTPRDTDASNAYALIRDSLGPVCMCSLIGINSIIPERKRDKLI